MDVDAEARARGLLEGTSCSDAQVVRLGHPGGPGDSPDLPIGAHLERDLIAQINELKHGLQLVVAIRPPSQDVQEQVELRGGGPGVAAHGERSQRSTATLTRTPARTRCSCAGSTSPEAER